MGDDSKNTNVNQRKSKNHEELNFGREKVKKYEKNRESKNGKCEILRPISGAEICLKKMMVTKDLSSRRKLRKVFKKNLSKKRDFMIKNIKKTESPKMVSKRL